MNKWLWSGHKPNSGGKAVQLYASYLWDCGYEYDYKAVKH
jgi:hypothetical protein